MPLLSDWWPGLDEFFNPGRELLLARTPADALAALDATDSELSAIAQAARERGLSEHTAERRALELENLLAQEVSSFKTQASRKVQTPNAEEARAF